MAINHTISTVRANHEQGQAVLLFLYYLLLLIALLPTQSLSTLAKRHDLLTMRKAKLAVIAWTAARYPGRDKKVKVRLGEFVLPDKDVATGIGAGTQDSTVSIGRLPWKTLGVTPFIDSHGEGLWYSVSSRLRDNGNAIQKLHCHALNQIAIYAPGYINAIITHDLAAVVIAPHRALSFQQRHSKVQQKQIHQYIESAEQGNIYSRINKQRYRYLMQGNWIKHDQLIGNDTILPIECRLLQNFMRKRQLT